MSVSQSSLYTQLFNVIIYTSKQYFPEILIIYYYNYKSDCIDMYLSRKR